MTTESTEGGLPPLHEAWLPRAHPLHRPRHGGKQIGALVCAAIFFAAPLVSLTFGARAGEIENRKLTEFPSPADGWSFFTTLPTWATDHLVFRDDAIAVADDVSRGVFGEPPALGKRGRTDNPLASGHVPQSDFDTSTIPRAIEGKDGWLYLGDEVVSRCKQSLSITDTLAQVRRLKDGIEASGREFVLAIAPDKITISPEYLPDRFPGKDCVQRLSDELWKQFGGEDYVLDLRDDIKRRAVEIGRPVYPALDAHWGDEGGLIMAQRLAERLRPGISAGWVVSPGQPWRVPADIPPLIGRSGDIDGRAYSVKPDGIREQAHDVPKDFNSPLHLTTTSGPGTYGRQVGMLGDSFSIRAKKYLGAAFGDITMMHYGQLHKDDARDEVVRTLAESDVVVVEIAERVLTTGNVVVFTPDVTDQILHEVASRPKR